MVQADLVVYHLALAVEVISAGSGGVLQGSVGEGGAEMVRSVGILIVGVYSTTFTCPKYLCLNCIDFWINMLKLR